MSDSRPLRGFKLFLHFLWCVPISLWFLYQGAITYEQGRWFLTGVNSIAGLWLFLNAFTHIDDYIDHINWPRVFWSILVTVACVVLWDYGIAGMKLLANTPGFWAWSLFMAALWYCVILLTKKLANGL